MEDAIKTRAEKFPEISIPDRDGRKGLIPKAELVNCLREIEGLLNWEQVTRQDLIVRISLLITAILDRGVGDASGLTTAQERDLLLFGRLMPQLQTISDIVEEHYSG